MKRKLQSRYICVISIKQSRRSFSYANNKSKTEDLTCTRIEVLLYIFLSLLLHTYLNPFYVYTLLPPLIHDFIYKLQLLYFFRLFSFLFLVLTMKFTEIGIAALLITTVSAQVSNSTLPSSTTPAVVAASTSVSSTAPAPTSLSSCAVQST